MATAARVVEEPGDSSEDSDELAFDTTSKPADSLDLIHKTLNGIAATCEDEGAEGLGRRARTFRLGRSMWQSAPLSEHDLTSAKEDLFNDDSFPSASESNKAATVALKEQMEQPAPFLEGTEPYASSTTTDFGRKNG